MSLVAVAEADYVTVPLEEEEDTTAVLTAEQRASLIQELETKMRNSAKAFEFERAAQFRDRIKALRTNDAYENASPTRPDRGG